MSRGSCSSSGRRSSSQVSDLAESAIGPEGLPFVGLGVTIFLFVLVCNWLAFIPSGDPGFLAPPTGDVNLPLALALIVFFTVHYNSVKARGVKGYFKHYAQPYAALTPINIIEEITKPITLTFRLFGNIFSGVLMVTVIVDADPALPVVDRPRSSGSRSTSCSSARSRPSSSPS